MFPNHPPSYSENALPPSYEPGVSVTRRLNNNDHAVGWMEVDGPKDRVMEPGSIVSGRAVINPTMPIKTSSVVVELTMVESVAKAKAYGESRVTREVALDKYIVPDGCLPRDKTFKRGMEYRVSYSMTLPYALPVGSCSSGIQEHYKLPPSIGGTSKRPEKDEHGSDFPARITYRVTAKVMGEEQPIITFYDNLRVFSYYLCNAVESCGHHSSGTNELKQGLIRKSSIGSCKLSMDNPQSVHLLSTSPLVYNLNVSYTPSTKDDFEPRTIQRVSYKLQAHTITSNKALGRIPVVNDPHCDTHTLNITNQKLEGPKLDWYQSEDYHVGSTHLRSYSACIPLPVVLPEIEQNNQLVASFSTCRTTRRYTLFVTVYFGSMASTTINVPLSVDAAAATPQHSPSPISSPSLHHESLNNASSVSIHQARRSQFGATPPNYEAAYPFASTSTQDETCRDGRVTSLFPR